MMWILRKNCSARRRKKLDHLPVLFENKKSDNHIIFLEATKGIKLPGRCFFLKRAKTVQNVVCTPRTTAVGKVLFLMVHYNIQSFGMLFCLLQL